MLDAHPQVVAAQLPLPRPGSRHASPNTQRPMDTISPVSSASEMKSEGMRQPCDGDCHRTSASTPVTAPVRRSTTG